MSRLLSCPLLCLLLSSVFVSSLGAEEVTDVRPSPRGFLGIIHDAANPPAGGGVTVKVVMPETSAAKAGVQPGDVITLINDQVIHSIEDMENARNGIPNGSPFTLKVKRKTEDLTLKGIMMGLPMGKIIKDQRNEEALQGALRDRLNTLRSRQDDISLAEAMQNLALALNQFPEKVKQASEEFKRVYPNGHFSVRIEIDIDTDTTIKQKVNVSPEALAPKDTPKVPEPKKP